MGAAFKFVFCIKKIEKEQLKPGTGKDKNKYLIFKGIDPVNISSNVCEVYMSLCFYERIYNLQ